MSATDDRRLQEALARLRQRLTHPASALPSELDLLGVRAPSCDGLRVCVPGPQAPTERDLVERLDRLLRERARVEARPDGQPVEAGDELVVDTVAYQGGRLMPGGLRFGLCLADDGPPFPGLRPLLQAATVGSCREVELPSLEGGAAVLVVDVRAARKVTLPDLSSTEGLFALGRGETLDAVMDSVAAELTGEAILAAQERAQDAVLDLLASRVDVPLLDAHVDAELFRGWFEQEGRTLGSRQFSEEEQAEALALWTANPEHRERARRRLRISVALTLVRWRDGLTLTQEGVDALLASLGSQVNLPRDALVTVLRRDRELLGQAQALALHLAAVEHVMKHAEVEWGEPG